MDPNHALLLFLLVTSLKEDKGGKKCIDKKCPSALKQQCFPEGGASQSKCHRRGCIWAPKTEGPWCFHPLPGPKCKSCDCPKKRKIDCYPGDGATEEKCVDKGCTWCDGSEGPKCVIVQVLEDAPCLDKKCPLSLREDCHEEQDATASKCHRRGCIWDPNRDDKSHPWCFEPTPFPKCRHCSCPVEQRHDCYPGDGADELKCLNLGCVWCPGSEPQCVAVDFEGVTQLVEWSTCSAECGGGTQWKFNENCNDEFIWQCSRTYRECNTIQCLPVSCSLSEEEERYGSEGSECCRLESDETCGVSPQSRIIGGQEADPGQWPWTALINVYKDGTVYMCGGFVVAPNLVVTAAHCVEDIVNPANVKVIVGEIEIAATNVEIPVAEIFFHPDYDTVSSLNDIAVLRIDKTLTFDLNVAPLCMPRGESPDVGINCVVAGWGETRTELPNVLLYADVKILPFDLCVDSNSNLELDSRLQICAGKIGGETDSCRGDSGGALMCQRCRTCNWYAAGLVSYGPFPCGVDQKPGVYTKIAAFEDWFYEVTGETKLNPVLPCLK